VTVPRTSGGEIRPVRRLSAATRRLLDDAIFGDSTFLLLSTIALSALGLPFWVACARYYTASEIGVATGLLAALNIVVSLSLLGLEVALVRYLPLSSRPSTLVWSSATLAGCASIAVGVVFVLLTPILSPDLAFMRRTPLEGLAFVLLCPVAICSFLIESALLSFRSTRALLGKNVAFGILKLAFLIGFVGVGAFGIYLSWMFGLLIAVLGAWWLLASRAIFRAHHRRLSLNELKPLWRFSSANYFGTLAEGLPVMVLPLIVLDVLGSADAARYYLAMTMCGVLQVIAVAGGQALFAEGARTGEVALQVRKAALFIGLLVVPGTAVIVFSGVRILRVVGATYAHDSRGLVTTLALSAPLVAVGALCRAVLKVREANIEIALTGGGCAIAILLLVYFFRGLGLTGVGLAWLTGQAITTGLLLAAVARTSTSAAHLEGV